jgi:hypothetical protein
MLILLARRAGRLEELRASLLARHPRLQVLALSVDLTDENDFDRGVPLVFPGRAYRIAMRALPLLPRELSRRQAARSATRIRRTADDAAHRDRPGGQAGA